MKKYTLLFLALGLTAPAFAKPVVKNAMVQEIYLAKQTTGGRFDVDQAWFSRQANDSLCWVAKTNSAQVGKTLNVSEVFRLPGKGEFTVDGDSSLKLTSSKDKKTWTIASKQTVSDEQLLQNCWVMTADDPTGEYNLTITINGQKQKPFTFFVAD